VFIRDQKKTPRSCTNMLPPTELVIAGVSFEIPSKRGGIEQVTDLKFITKMMFARWVNKSTTVPLKHNFLLPLDLRDPYKTMSGEISHHNCPILPHLNQVPVSPNRCITMFTEKLANHCVRDTDFIINIA